MQSYRIYFTVAGGSCARFLLGEEGATDIKSYRLSTIDYPKYTLAELALVLAEMNPENKKASNGKPGLPKKKKRLLNI